MDAGKVFGDPTEASDRRKWFLIVVLLAIAATLAPAHADAKDGDRRTVTKKYISGDGGPWMSTAVCDPSSDSYHVGAACFGAVESGYVRLSIEDESGRRVGGHAVISDGNGMILYRESFCETSGPIRLQSGVLFVHLDGLDSYEPGCSLGAVGFATIGQVRATFMAKATEPSRAQGRSLRAGTIVSGVLTTGPAGDCDDVPDCAVWLASDCDPALTGRDPAWLASIENVADLADGKTRRLFEYGPARPGGWILGGMTVEFWREDCTRIVEVDTWDDAASRAQRRTALFVPRDAEWMTVTANDNVNAAWTLKDL